MLAWTLRVLPVVLFRCHLNSVWEAAPAAGTPAGKRAWEGDMPLIASAGGRLRNWYMYADLAGDNINMWAGEEEHTFRGALFCSRFSPASRRCRRNNLHRDSIHHPFALPLERLRYADSTGSSAFTSPTCAFP